MKKISIIVPIYNVEKYLRRCIDSLVNQTHENIEIILIDDESPDNCGEICDKYANLNSKIRVIHKENGGLSDARNTGLMQATGDYILFVDSDDYIIATACEEFVKIISNNDIDVAIGDATRIIGNKEYSMCFDKKYLGQIQSGEAFLKHQIKKRSISVMSCRNMYKRSYLIENNILFKTGIFHEDEEWLPRALLGTDKVILTGINFYRYIIREDSITQKKDKEKNARDLLTICYSLESTYSSIVDIELKEVLEEYLLKLYLNAVCIGKLYKANSKQYLYDEFIKGKAKSTKCRLQVIIYRINKKLFCILYRLFS